MGEMKTATNLFVAFFLVLGTACDDGEEQGDTHSIQEEENLCSSFAVVDPTDVVGEVPAGVSNDSDSELVFMSVTIDHKLYEIGATLSKNSSGDLADNVRYAERLVESAK